MILFIRLFLIFAVLFHIISVGLIYWLDIGIWSAKLAIIREAIWLCFVITVTLIHYKKSKLKNFFQQNKKLWIATIFLFGYSILFSLTVWKTPHDIIVGVKYTIWYMVIFLTATIIWASLVTNKENKINRLIERLGNFLIAIIITGLIRQWAKHITPTFFEWRGYWPVWDFIFGEAPPIYYRTWPWWFPRLSWLFSGPNNYWYFIVLFTGLLLHRFNSSRKIRKSKSIAESTVYWFTLARTISRGAIVWVISQVIILIRQLLSWVRHKKMIIWIWITLVIITFSWISVFKWWSTLEHINRKRKWVEYVINNPMWFGLWTAWPAVHHNWTILPENYYIQILADIGFIWFLLWIIRWLILFGTINKYIIGTSSTNQYAKNTFYLMTLWLFGLMLEWLFLHVFEDSMVNYLFFVPYWILFWYLIQQKILQTTANQQRNDN